MELSEVKEKAILIRNWIEDATGDTAGTNFTTLMTNIGHDEKAKAKVEQAKKDGVIDICGWYADELYNDRQWLHDLTGDRIFDEANGSYDDMILIARQMQDNAHEALIQALQEHIDDWEQRAAIVVVCVHCARILKQKGNPEMVSHSDCLAYFKDPCEKGRTYHWRLSKQLGYDSLKQYLDTFRVAKRQI